MNCVDLLENYIENNDVHFNGGTRSASLHMALTGVAYELDREGVEKLLTKSAELFFNLQRYTDKDIKRFSRDRFVKAGLNFYDYIVAESIFNELDMKEILEIK
jgi:hypothetical protein